MNSRMLKIAASSVLASEKSSTYPRGYASGFSSAAALLDGHFEHSGKWCGYCVADALMHIGVFALTLPEAARALHVLMNHQPRTSNPEPQTVRLEPRTTTMR
jgi:hypothetical protein